MSVPRAVDERPTPHARGLAGERGMTGNRFEALVAVEVRGIEVVPDRDPVEAELLDAMPQRAQLVDGGVLESRVHTEGQGHMPPKASPPVVLTVRSSRGEHAPCRLRNRTGSRSGTTRS